MMMNRDTANHSFRRRTWSTPANCASSCSARAWFLSRQGYRVSAKGESHRADGIAFHQRRAAAAQRGASRWLLRWAIILATTGIAILILQFWGGGI
jgi:hypothetical protein